ncbi:MAG: PBSX family phage terminase large subunit, partial [Clostridia bacterium]|nr:PBSX family phage terminase large subunit [Clostridia bacterium]
DEYYYDARKTGERRTDEEHLQALLEKLGGCRPCTVVVDPSAASFITLLQRERLPVLPAVNDVVDGIRRTAGALKTGRIKICCCCVDAVREFGLYRWKENAGRDAPVKEFDHAMDDIRYFVSTWLERSGGEGAFVAVRRPG